MILVYISLIINIAVAGFWGIVLSFNLKSNPADTGFGADAVSRRILGNLYLAIATISILPFIEPKSLEVIVGVLFPMQIFYKVLSFLTVKDKKNPVTISNIIIAVIHSISLYILF